MEASCLAATIDVHEKQDTAGYEGWELTRFVE